MSIKITKTAWSYLKPNEAMFVLFGLFFFLAIITLGVMLRQPETFQSTVRYENLPPEKKQAINTYLENLPIGDSDKNERFAERVREASSIGLGLSLFLVNERIHKNRVLSLGELMSEFSRSDLLPPKIIVLFPQRGASYGLLETNRGLYYVNYSAKPLRIEVLAGSANGLADGAVFVLRVPDTSAANLKPLLDSSKVSSAGAWATLFEAPEVANHYIPPPFSPAPTFAAMGWQIRPLQQTEMSDERVREMNDFLQKQQ